MPGGLFRGNATSTINGGLVAFMTGDGLWVCCVLDHLFRRSDFAGSMVFKGGTSLSKAYGLIERFSEDIDLILDWRMLGYGFDEPWQERSMRPMIFGDALGFGEVVSYMRELEVIINGS